MAIDIPSTGKPCTKCGERDGNPLHDGICNVCYSNSLSKEEMLKKIFNNAQKRASGEQGAEVKKKKDPFAIWGFVVGIVSVFLGMGLPPIVAIILSGIGINKTKEPGTGRWMAVTGLVLGILYFVVYLYNFGYI